jgi:hypothetical protein
MLPIRLRIKTAISNVFVVTGILTACLVIATVYATILKRREIALEINRRSTLLGGLPVCYGDVHPRPEDLDAVVAFFISEDSRGTNRKFSCALVQGGADFSIVEDRGRIVKIYVWGSGGKDAWTYRENVYNEPPDKMLALIDSILEKAEPSRQGFIHPRTGQIEDCPELRAAISEPLRPDLDCDKEVRAKGFIRSDEYKSTHVKKPGE